MNTYRIQHKIKTLSQLSFGKPEGTKIEIDGYKFENWGFSLQKGTYGNAWIVEKNIQANDYNTAINIFRKELKPIAQKLCFISQCYFEYGDQSFIIERLNNNQEKEFLLQDIREGVPVGLHFTENEFKDYKKLSKIGNNVCFIYLQACNNTIGYYPKLSLLLSAVEALAGEEQKEVKGKPRTQTNKGNLKKILGEDYYKKLFGDGGIRHKIHHGKYNENITKEDHVDLIYKRILEYLNRTYDLKLSLDIVAPQRHFYGNLNRLTQFRKPKKKGTKIDLKEIPKNIEKCWRTEKCPFAFVNRSSDGY